MNIKLLRDVSISDVDTCGGKGASLGEMLRAGLPVPDGFVITTDAFRSGMSKELEKVILDSFDQLGAQRVAVRSSAVAEDSTDASWAGQLETVLNVRRDGLIKAVHICWQSIASEHAVQYAAQNNVPTSQQAVAVVVQAMVDSQIAGVMFTANPVTGNRDELMIEAAYGLGELLVQGTITPESIVVNKNTGAVISRSQHSQDKKLVYTDSKNTELPVPSDLQNKDILTEEQIKQLADLANKIETHYGKPQDIEWAIAGNKLYITQSRPITTLTDPIPNKAPSESKIDWVMITQKNYPMFSRYWILEAFRIDMKQALGREFTNFKNLQSGVYADKQQFEELQTLLIQRLEKDSANIWKLCEEWEKACDTSIATAKKLTGKQLSSLSADQLLELVEEIVRQLRASAAYIFLHHTLSPYFEAKILSLLAERSDHSAKKGEYFQSLTTPKRQTGIAKSQADIGLLVQNPSKNAVEKYAATYMWLGYETALGQDLTVTEVLEKVKNFQTGVVNRPDRQAIEKKLQLNRDEIELLDLFGEIIYLGKYREEAHMKVGVYLRPILEALAARLSLTYDELVRLTPPEINQAVSKGQPDRKLIKSRQHKYGLVMLDGTYAPLSGKEVEQFEHQLLKKSGQIDSLQGVVANSGWVKGPAKVVLSRADFAKVRSYDIVVASMTSADYIPILSKCAGIITDVGGITSHAAVIARELHKPCITGTKLATQAINDGDTVELDANSGTITILADDNS